MNNLESLNIYVSPSLKTIDKEFYSKLEYFIHLYKMNNIDNMKSSKLSNVYFLSSETNIKEIELSQFDIVFVCLSLNLDMFEEKTVNDRFFEIKNITELDDIFIMLRELVRLHKLELNHHISIGQKSKVHKISKQKHLEVNNNFFYVYSVDKNIQSIKDYLLDHYQISHGLLSFNDLEPHHLESIVSIGELNGVQYYLDTSSDGPEVGEIYISLIHLFKIFEEENELTQELNFWKSSILDIDLPLAYTSIDNKLILQNSLFSELNFSAKDLLRFSNHELINQDGTEYKLFKKEVKDRNIYIFCKVDSLSSSDVINDNNELGIITSSIAHELNNPLAGILAALDVLMLDDFDDEIFLKLIEMKKTVQRCKNLVETFLGFSRFNLVENTSTSLSICYEQAFELIRSRLVEGNISIKMNHIQKNDFNIMFNKHVLVILIYLFMSEILTQYSHQNLVDEIRNKNLELNLIELRDTFEIRFIENVEVPQSFIYQKLISPLLGHLNLKVHLSPGKIIFNLAKDALSES